MTSRERHLQIGTRRIGPGEPCYVIAEIGLNHNGSLDIAKQLVDAAVAAGADAVKFQKRTLVETYRREILEQPRRGEQGLQYIVPLLVEFELSDDDFRELHQYCRARGTTFMCTPWDLGSVDFLETMALDGYKIGSPDMTNFPLIEHVVSTRKPLLISTGMSTEEEIRRTLSGLKITTRVSLTGPLIVARDLASPSPLSHAILNARPYAFLDDGAAEERRTKAVATKAETTRLPWRPACDVYARCCMIAARQRYISGSGLNTRRIGKIGRAHV
mgnify:CR=1 FL=1